MYIFNYLVFLKFLTLSKNWIALSLYLASVHFCEFLTKKIPIATVWFSRHSTQSSIDLSVSADESVTLLWGPQKRAALFCAPVIRWLVFCLSSRLNQAFHGLFWRPTCFLWHLHMNAIGQFVFHKDDVVRGGTDALITPHWPPSNRPQQLSCSSVCQPTWCLFIGFIGSLYCAQSSLNLFN